MSPTGSPQLYRLPTIATSVAGNYECRLSPTQHFIQIVDCNEDNISTRQCQLMCHRKYIQSKCSACYPSSLTSHLLGVSVGNEQNKPACSINEYAECMRLRDNATDAEMKECLAACRPACSYWNYDMSVVERSNNPLGTTLIAPTSDYIEFAQQRAYTVFGIVADIGGLLCVLLIFIEFVDYICSEFWVGIGLMHFLHIFVIMYDQVHLKLKTFNFLPNTNCRRRRRCENECSVAMQLK